jgi:4-amino-4-deoxy-L-arabinose transferase-like glycosyltransferase
MVHSSTLSDSSKPICQKNLLAIGASTVAVLVCLFGNLGAIGLTGPDEPRYAWIARAMAESGDWVTPRLYGQPWFEKPILYYWAAGLGFRAQLPPEWAARLPSALAALAAACAVSWLAWKFSDPDKDFALGPLLLAPLLFSSTVAAIGFSRAATPDMLFSSALALAMSCAAGLLLHQSAFRAATWNLPPSTRKDVPLLTGWGAFLGTAFLAKGPAALILAGGAVAIWALVARNLRPLFRLIHPLAVAAFAIIALPWYALCARRNPEFLRIFLWQHNFERYFTPLFLHRRSFWFFVPVFLLALLPWTALLWPAGREFLRLGRDGGLAKSPALFFACWTVCPILFFSFSQSKLPVYVLPSLPPAALLLVMAWAKLAKNSSKSRRAIHYSLAALGFTWICLAAGAFLWFGRLAATEQADLRGALLPVLIVASVGGIAIILLGFFQANLALILQIFLAVLCVSLCNRCFLPALDPYISARPHAELLQRSRFPHRIFTYQLARGWNYGLAFYLCRELPEWSSQDPQAVLLLTTPQGLRKVEEQGRLGGTLEETYRGILFVPVLPAARGGVSP